MLLKIKHFFELIRYKNLVMLIFVQVLFSFVFFSEDINLIKIFLIIQATTLIAAGGNIINDYFDIETDRINKPNKLIVSVIFTKKQALLLYGLFTFSGLLSALILCIIVNKPFYFFIFISIAIVLYLYSTQLKKIAFLGNLTVSLLIGFSILILSIFPPTNTGILPQNYDTYLVIYASFAFFINFIREIVKDLEDINGDYNVHMKTLPIIIGRKRTQNIVFYATSVLFMGLIVLVSTSKLQILQIYTMLFIAIPLGYFMYKIKEAKSKQECNRLSILLKIIMLFGILSIVILKTH